jgi:hypothetical protein
LKGEKLASRLLFEQVQPLLESDPEAYLIFELDTVLDKRFGPKIELAQSQWSGNEKRPIRGIGVLSCVYVNPKTENFWVIDYRIFDPKRTAKASSITSSRCYKERRASAGAFPDGADG